MMGGWAVFEGGWIGRVLITWVVTPWIGEYFLVWLGYGLVSIVLFGWLVKIENVSQLVCFIPVCL